jgi:broad-specificity NMP kinase
MSITHQLSLQDVIVSLEMHPEGQYKLTLKRGKEETNVQGNYKAPQSRVVKAVAQEQKKPSKYLQERSEDEMAQYVKVLKEKYEQHQKQSKWATMAKAARRIGTDVEESEVAAYDEWKATYNGIEKNRWQLMKTFLERRNERNERK